MCNFSGKLIAWLDHELGEAEAVNVEWHVRRCAECRCAVNAYRQISGAFLGCYEAAVIVQRRRKMPLWAWGAVAAAVILLVIFLAQPRAEKLAVNLPARPQAPPMAFEKPAFQKAVPPARIPAVRVRRVAAPMPRWIAEEPTVEVALPADALFPPGAVPSGFSFIADIHPQP
jgi:hypothetical protein